MTLWSFMQFLLISDWMLVRHPETRTELYVYFVWTLHALATAMNRAAYSHVSLAGRFQCDHVGLRIIVTLCDLHMSCATVETTHFCSNWLASTLVLKWATEWHIRENLRRPPSPPKTQTQRKPQECWPKFFSLSMVQRLRKYSPLTWLPWHTKQIAPEGDSQGRSQSFSPKFPYAALRPF